MELYFSNEQMRSVLRKNGYQIKKEKYAYKNYVYYNEFEYKTVEIEMVYRAGSPVEVLDHDIQNNSVVETVFQQLFHNKVLELLMK